MFGAAVFLVGFDSLDPRPNSPPLFPPFRSRRSHPFPRSSAVPGRLRIIIHNLLRAKTLSLRLSLEREACFAGREHSLFLSRASFSRAQSHEKFTLFLPSAA